MQVEDCLRASPWSTDRSPRLPRTAFRPFRPQPRDAAARSFGLASSTSSTRFGLRHTLAGSPQHPAESGSSSYGPTVRLRLLPTPPRDDAVTFSYRALAYSDTDSHRADNAPSRAYERRHPAGRGAKRRFLHLIYSMLLAYSRSRTPPGGGEPAGCRRSQWRLRRLASEYFHSLMAVRRLARNRRNRVGCMSSSWRRSSTSSSPLTSRCSRL